MCDEARQFIDDRQVLQDVFGYQTYRPGQMKAISATLTGKDTIVRLGTSAGKSLCYQVPLLTKGTRCIVISPLSALMHDQVSSPPLPC